LPVHGAGEKVGARRGGAVIEADRPSTAAESGGLHIAVVAFTDHPADFAAAQGQPGVAYAGLASGAPHWLTGQVRALASTGQSASGRGHRSRP
jgi:hypothetical protein